MPTMIKLTAPSKKVFMLNADSIVVIQDFGNLRRVYTIHNDDYEDAIESIDEIYELIAQEQTNQVAQRVVTEELTIQKLESGEINIEDELEDLQ